ncbi:MAG: hypothetical protein ACRDDZ_09710 [Marinifilaceae bacterium]
MKNTLTLTLLIGLIWCNHVAKAQKDLEKVNRRYPMDVILSEYKFPITVADSNLFMTVWQNKFSGSVSFGLNGEFIDYKYGLPRAITVLITDKNRLSFTINGEVFEGEYQVRKDSLFIQGLINGKVYEWGGYGLDIFQTYKMRKDPWHLTPTDNSLAQQIKGVWIRKDVDATKVVCADFAISDSIIYFIESVTSAPFVLKNNTLYYKSFDKEIQVPVRAKDGQLFMGDVQYEDFETYERNLRIEEKRKATNSQK